MKDNFQRLPNSVRNEFLNARMRRKLQVTSEKALRTNELLRVYLENVEDVITTLSVTGEIKYISPSSRYVYGYSDVEMMEMGFIRPSMQMISLLLQRFLRR